MEKIFIDNDGNKNNGEDNIELFNKEPEISLPWESNDVEGIFLKPLEIVEQRFRENGLLNDKKKSNKKSKKKIKKRKK